MKYEQIRRKYEEICSSIHGPWDMEKFRALTGVSGSVTSSERYPRKGSQFQGLGGTPEKRHETCQYEEIYTKYVEI